MAVRDPLGETAAVGSPGEEAAGGSSREKSWCCSCGWQEHSDGSSGAAQNERSCGQAVGIRILSIGGRTSHQAEFYWSDSYSIDGDSRNEIRFQPTETKARGGALRATKTQRTNAELFPNRV